MIPNEIIRRRPIAAIFVAAIVCAQTAFADETTTTKDPYVTAQEDFKAERYAAAILSIRAALQADADDPRAAPIRMYLAEALLFERRAAEAAIEYEAFLQSVDDGEVKSLATYRRIEALYFADDFATVVAEAGTFLDDHPRHSGAPRVWIYLGNSYSHLGDYAAAEAAMARVAADFPDDVLIEHALPAQASLLLTLDRPQAAWVVLSARLRHQPEGKDKLIEELAGNALNALGNEAIDHNRFDDADGHFDRLIKLFPRHPSAPYAALRRAEIAQLQGDWETAAERFDAAIKLCDADLDCLASAWLGRISCLAQEQRWDEVASLAASAKTRCNQWPRAYEFDYLRGRALFADAELNDARTAFANVAASPASAGTETGVLAHFMTAEIHRLQKNYEPALVEYDTVAAAAFPEWQDEAQAQAQQIRKHLAALKNFERK